MHVVHSLQTGGMENGVVNLINRMDWERFRHSICCISTSGEMEKRILRNDVRVFEMKKGDGNSFTLPMRLAALFRRERVDIVHTRNWGTVDGILGARMALITKVVHGEHGREANDPDGLNKKRNFLRRALGPFVNRYIAVSRDLEQWLVNVVGIKKNKVATIINGVDTDVFIPAENKSKSKIALGLLPEEIIIGAVGRLDPVKDYTTLINAFASLYNSYKNIKLMIVGNGPEENNLRKCVEHAGIKDRVSFLGRKDNIHELLRAMDIFVLPSLAEGISNTILEAFASGLPVIATNVGGNPELIKDKYTGFLFLPGDVDGLTVLLKNYVEDTNLMVSHGDAGRKTALNEFSLDDMVKSYENLYMRV
jgi:sugar transferase (PEP-CTERM/EpsH1 system associated)